jgi:hypothetical protein
MALPFKFKSTLRKKKNYENSNISPCKNIIFKKSENSEKDDKTLKKLVKALLQHMSIYFYF